MYRIVRYSPFAAIIMAAGLSAPGLAVAAKSEAAVLNGHSDVSIEYSAAKRKGGDGGGKAHAGKKATSGGKVSANKRTNVNRTTVNKRTNVNVNRSTNVNVNRNVNVVNRPVRGWVHRPYYGTLVGGVALGTIIAVSAAGAVPTAPGPNMCWFWSDAAQINGYWDYCTPP